MANLRPTFHESWYRVKDLKAKLRPSAQISRQHYRGERWYVVRDPAGNQYHRLSSAAYRFVGLLDGSRTVAEAWDLAGGMLADDAPTQPEVVQILSQLHAANLLEANITADAGVLLRRHKKMMKRRLQSRLMNVLFPRIPLWDPDRFLVKWMPVMKFAFLNFFGIFLWLGVVIAGVMAVAPEWSRLQTESANAIHPANWPFLWATFVIIKLIHELGHAFTCRRFGGEVHELGIMFLVFMPAPYVDASSAWSLPSKWQRILVGAGGMIFELFVAAMCAFVWKYTAPTELIHQLAYNAMLIASVSTVIFNANPLLRYDGYYMLSDYLEIPNLRQKSMEYSLGLIKRHVFRVKSPIPLPPVGQRFWLLLYAISSGIYRVFIGVMIILLVAHQVPVLGVLMALGGVVTWLVVPVVKTGNYLLLDPELHRKRPRAIAFTLAVVAAVVVLIGFINFPVRFPMQAMVEPQQKQTLRARTPGFVRRVLVRDGQRVQAGQEMVVAEDLQLEAQLRSQEAEVRSIQARIDANVVLDQAERQIHEYSLRAARSKLDLLQKQYDDLAVRAPFAGTVVAPMIHELSGKYVRQGEDVATVIQADPLVVRAVVDQKDAPLLFLDEPMWIPLEGLPGGWNADPVAVSRYLESRKVAYQEDPPEDRRQAGEPARRILVPRTTVLFDRAAAVEFAFDYGRLATITARFAGAGEQAGSGGAYDQLRAEHTRRLGEPEKDPDKGAAAGAWHTRWVYEGDQSALDVELTEQGGAAAPKAREPAGAARQAAATVTPVADTSATAAADTARAPAPAADSGAAPTTTLVYRILGRKADVRLAAARSENLTARVLTRVPAATSRLPHASLSYAGGGEHQADPSAQQQHGGEAMAATPVFEVRLRLENKDLKLLPGQRANVRITMEKDRPLLWQWSRRFWQLLQTESAHSKWL